MSKHILSLIFKYVFLKNKFPILMYHQINDSGSPLAVSPQNFDRQMRFFYNLGYKTINLASFYDFIYNQKPLPPKSFLITFDDGYRDNLLVAKPILDKYGLKGVIFVSTNYIGKKSVFCTNKEDQDREILTEKELIQIENSGWDIANHFHSHRPLTDLTEEEIKEEVDRSKKILTRIIRKKENALYCAVPKEKIDEKTRKVLINKGIKLLFEDKGLVDKKTNPYQIPRVEIFYSSLKIKFLIRFSPYYHYFKKLKENAK